MIPSRVTNVRAPAGCSWASADSSNLSKENDSTDGCFLKREHAVLAIFVLSCALFSPQPLGSRSEETPVSPTFILFLCPRLTSNRLCRGLKTVLDISSPRSTCLTSLARLLRAGHPHPSSSSRRASLCPAAEPLLRRRKRAPSTAAHSTPSSLRCPVFHCLCLEHSNGEGLPGSGAVSALPSCTGFH